MHERDRQHLQKVLSSSPISHKFRNYSDLHRYHSPDKQPNKDFVYDITLRLLLNEPVTYDLVDRILVHFEHWWFFLSSKLYSLYARSVQIAHYSKSKNPGSIDTQQAIYLAACDVFVTEDKKQRNMLRLSVPLGHKKGRFGIIRCS